MIRIALDSETTAEAASAAPEKGQGRGAYV
jgi:hypothetical protein